LFGNLNKFSLNVTGCEVRWLYPVVELAFITILPDSLVPMMITQKTLYAVFINRGNWPLIIFYNLNLVQIFLGMFGTLESITDGLEN
jgi:hypothetical protein